MALDIPPDIDLSIIFEREDVKDAFAGHCAKTHLDNEAVENCNYCTALRVTLAFAIIEWRDICALEAARSPAVGRVTDAGEQGTHPAPENKELSICQTCGQPCVYQGTHP